MPNCSHSRCRRTAVSSSDPPISEEPPVRRWPHPIAPSADAQQEENGMLSIRCALACQTRLLEEIRDLLADTNALFTAGNALSSEDCAQLTAALAVLTQIEKNTASDAAAKE